MRKVTKILLKVLSVTLLFLIFCPIVLTLVVELPSVQNYLVDKATALISKIISKIRYYMLAILKFFSRVLMGPRALRCVMVQSQMAISISAKHPMA